MVKVVQVAEHGVVKVRAGQRLRPRRRLQAQCRAVGAGHGHGAVQRHHRQGAPRQQLVVEPADGEPVRFPERRGPAVLQGDARLQVVGAGVGGVGGPAQVAQPAGNERLAPAAAVLVFEQYQVAVGVGAGGQPGGLQAEQGQQGMGAGQVGAWLLS